MRKAILLAATGLCGALATSPAQAQSAAQLEAIQSQISNLQSELRRLQKQGADRDVALKRAQDDAIQAKLDARRAVETKAILGAPSGMNAGEIPVVLVQGKPDPVTGKPAASGKFRIGDVTITLGGYFDLTGIYRSRNVTSGPGTPYNRIPFDQDPNAHVDELRGSSQATRVSVLVEGHVSDTTALAGFAELDLLGAATTSNSYQSNSYTPRVRHAYVQYDDTALGVHVLAGQTWSLATQFSSGLIPRKELIPMVIDHQYVPGFVYTRNPQLRIVKDFGQKYWIGASIEAPQSVYAIGPTTASGGTLPALSGSATGAGVLYNNPGGSFLNSTATYSIDAGPDIVVKAAADPAPGWGHYEVYGIGRFLRTRSSLAGVRENRSEFAGGVGGGVVLPVSKFVDLSGSILGGYGIGRYVTSNLPDATFQANGEPAPLPEVAGLIGAVGHVTKALDVYAYGGMEQIGRSTFRSGSGAKATLAGYGQGTVDVSGCGVEGSAASTCGAQTRSIVSGALGAWWRPLRGPWGTLQWGAQYSYTKRIAFHGTGGPTPKTDDNVIYLTLRYLPFL